MCAHAHTRAKCALRPRMRVCYPLRMESRQNNANQRYGGVAVASISRMHLAIDAMTSFALGRPTHPRSGAASSGYRPTIVHL